MSRRNGNYAGKSWKEKIPPPPFAASAECGKLQGKRKGGDTMELLLGGLAGLAWGLICGLVNILILKKAITKNDNNAIMAANLARMAVDLAALGAVFLLRKVLPFSFEAALIGTAVALSVVTIVYAYRYGKK